MSTDNNLPAPSPHVPPYTPSVTTGGTEPMTPTQRVEALWSDPSHDGGRQVFLDLARELAAELEQARINLDFADAAAENLRKDLAAARAECMTGLDNRNGHLRDRAREAIREAMGA